MKEFVLLQLQALKALAAKTPTKIDDFVLDTVLSAPDLIEGIANRLDRLFGFTAKAKALVHPAGDPEARQRVARNQMLEHSRTHVQSNETAHGFTHDELKAFAAKGIDIGKLLPFLGLLIDALAPLLRK